jgi:adenylate cyclase
MPYEYQIGGSLKLNSPTYAMRQADRELHDALLAGEFCYVFNARQMGKSSLRVRTWHRLHQAGMPCAIIDLTSIGSEQVTPQQWYKSLAADLIRSFGLWQQINFKQWWQTHEGITPLRCFSLLFEEVIFTQLPDQRLFVFLDEVDSILSLKFPADDFFAFIRYCYNQQAVDPSYRRLTWALFGVTTPSDLIRDRTRTPFNLGRAIELYGFTEVEAQPLLLGLVDRVSRPQAVLREIIRWTDGQPFLTQKLCQLAVQTSERAIAEGGLTLAPGMEPLWVDELVKLHILDYWETQDQPEHLRTVRDRILHNELAAIRLLSIYQQVLAGDRVLIDDSSEQIELLLSGLVVSQQGQLRVKNQIYAAIFNADWVARQLEKLRPYASEFDHWIASQQSDAQSLLRGQDLEDALVWVQDKKLSDMDYRFLSASQNLAKQAVETALAAEKFEREKTVYALQAAQEANQLLAEARSRAKHRVRSFWLGKRWVVAIAAAIAGLVILLRYAGGFQTLEWMALDRFFQLRPPLPVETRITLVAIDEPDLQRLGVLPISDQVLAQTIQILKQHQPRLIGLDLYRDLPVEPGAAALKEVFQTTPNLIGITKSAAEKVGAPKDLLQRDRIGFVDQVIDEDGTVRRALLSLRDQNKQTRLSLALKLALEYLATEQITPRPILNSKNMQIGKAVLVPFRSHDGGYVRANAGGFQILLNFQGDAQKFETISLTDVLSNRFTPAVIRDRIILIGQTAESVNDFFQTPYNNQITGGSNQMSGVVLHANIISHLLRAAIADQSTIKTWSESIEILWILVCSGIGASLAWRLRLPGKIVLAVLVAVTGLILLTYTAFLWGWWLPLIPAAVGLVMAAATLPNITQRQAERIQLRQILDFLDTAAETQPAAARIAIEYLKQSESSDQQATIDAVVRQKW